MGNEGHTGTTVQETHAASFDPLDALGDLVGASPTVRSALGAVRDFMGMEIAYATRITEDSQVFEVLDGDGGSFGFHEGFTLPIEETYCRRVLTGRLPNLIPDVRVEDRAASLSVTHTADIGAFAAVPLVLSDGGVYGTLCACSHDAMTLGYRDLQFLRVFARIVADQIEREQLQDRTDELIERAHGLEVQAAAAKALIAAVEARDSYTAEHSMAVVDQAVAVGRELGLSDSEIVDVKHVALLHDIGKVAVPDSVLGKEGPLDDSEWEIMRRHPVSSYEMVLTVPGLKYLAPMVRAEHERWDGTGYPDGLAGEDIPLPSRITLVCDAYHAMTSDRPYRAALSRDAALAEIEANLGTQFCPAAGAALLKVLEGSVGPSGPPGAGRDTL